MASLFYFAKKTLHIMKTNKLIYLHKWRYEL